MRKRGMWLLISAMFATFACAAAAGSQDITGAGNAPARDSAGAPPIEPPATAARTWRASFEPALNYTHDASANLRGGSRRGVAARGLLMAQLTVDLATLAGFSGTRAFVSYASLGGTNGSSFAGDIQAFSNIDTSPFTHLYEAWIEQSIGSAARFKVGRVDANTEFAVVGAAGDFSNASAGFSPSILGLPTYPDPKASASAFVHPASWLAVSTGVFAGTFDAAAEGASTVHDVFTIGQVDGVWKRIGRLAGGKLGIGAWHHSGLAARFDGGSMRGADGWWATLEQRVGGTVATDSTPASGVQFFAKYGRAPEMLSVFREHVMAGLLLDGGLRAGSDDAMGFAMSHANLSDVPEARTPLNETSYEVFYKVRLAGFLTVRPNVQYIVNPSGDPALRNALVVTIRSAIAF